MNSPKVSVIIPVYNVDHYLEQCVNSILGQSFGDFELILVDDGSKDQSGAICDEYTNIDARVKVVHQPNAGLPAARKVGINIAQGDYVLFVDADDWVDPQHIESLVKKAEKDKADVVFCGFIFEYPRKQVRIANNPHSSLGKDIVIECLNNYIHAGIVFKIVRRELFVDYQIRFPKYNYFEDMYLSTQILLYAIKISSSGETTYHYRYNHSSETHGKSAAFRIQKFNEFHLNMHELFDICSLWSDKDMRTALYRRINKEKLELLMLPFDAGMEIRKAFRCYADSWKEYKVGVNPIKLLNYLALRYGLLFGAQLYIHFRVIVRNTLKGT